MKRLLSKGIDTQKTTEEPIKGENKEIISESLELEVVDFTQTLLQLIKEGKNNRDFE